MNQAKREEERLREDLATFCKLAYDQHLVSSAGGNLSARIGDSDRVLISPGGFSLRDCAAEDFITVDLDGKKTGGRDDLIPSKEAGMHTAVYKVRPQARAIAHLHPRACIIFANQLRPIPLVTVSARAKLGFTPLVAEAPSGSQALAGYVKRAVEDAPDSNFFLLEGHGSLAIAGTVREATYLTDLAEDTAQIALDLALGSPTLKKPRLWDISVRSHPKMQIYPGDPEMRITRARAIARGDQANVSEIVMGVHTGTHIDCPYHFLEGGATLEQTALESTIGEAVVADLRGLRQVTAASLKEVSLGAGDILLCRTDNSELWEKDRFESDYVSITEDGAMHLVERQVKAVGVDYLSVEAFGSTDFNVHKILLGAGVAIIEGLDLRRVVPGRYHLVCLPLALSGTEGAPARAILLELDGRGKLG